MYDILRDKKFKKFKSPFMTIHPENITMILHMQKDLFFSPNNILCVPRVFFAHQDWKQLHNKSILSIVFKNMWQNLVFGDFCSSQNIVSLNLTCCRQKYPKIIIHKQLKLHTTTPIDNWANTKIARIQVTCGNKDVINVGATQYYKTPFPLIQ